jgi:hypothetical protein
MTATTGTQHNTVEAVNLTVPKRRAEVIGDRARRLIKRTTDEQALPFHVEDPEVLKTISSALIGREQIR